MAAPAETIYACDIFCSATTMNLALGTDGVVSRMNNTASMRHNDGFNSVYADGHAKWLKEPEYSYWTIEAD